MPTPDPNSLVAFARCHQDTPWRPVHRFTLYRTTAHRLRVLVEQSDAGAEGLARDEALAQRGIDASDADAKEFASTFVATVAGQLSEVDLEHLIAALQVDLAERVCERVRRISATRPDMSTAGQPGPFYGAHRLPASSEACAPRPERDEELQRLCPSCGVVVQERNPVPCGREYCQAR